MIWPDGRIESLVMRPDTRLVVRDHVVGVTVEEAMALTESAVLALLLEDGDWQSTITVADGVVPDLAGTLRIDLGPSADLADMLGKAFRLFDWNGQLPAGDAFDRIATRPGLQWDTSRLYTTGDVVLQAIPEPSSLLLACAGLFATLGVGSRR